MTTRIDSTSNWTIHTDPNTGASTMHSPNWDCDICTQDQCGVR